MRSKRTWRWSCRPCCPNEGEALPRLNGTRVTLPKPDGGEPAAGIRTFGTACCNKHCVTLWNRISTVISIRELWLTARAAGGPQAIKQSATVHSP